MADEPANPAIQDDWAGAFAAARSEATANRPKNPKAPKQSPGPPVTEDHKQLAEIANALAKPEYWEGIVRAPADYMLATTGHKHWDIPDRQVNKIAVPLAFSAKTFIGLDPRVMLLILLFSNIGTVYGPLAVEEYQIRKREALDKVETRELKT